MSKLEDVLEAPRTYPKATRDEIVEMSDSELVALALRDLTQLVEVDKVAGFDLTHFVRAPMCGEKQPCYVCAAGAVALRNIKDVCPGRYGIVIGEDWQLDRALARISSMVCGGGLAPDDVYKKHYKTFPWKAHEILQPTNLKKTKAYMVDLIQWLKDKGR